MEELKKMIVWSSVSRETLVPNTLEVRVDGCIPELDLRGHITVMLRQTPEGFEQFEKLLLSFEQEFVASCVRQLKAAMTTAKGTN